MSGDARTGGAGRQVTGDGMVTEEQGDHTSTWIFSLGIGRDMMKSRQTGDLKTESTVKQGIRTRQDGIGTNSRD